MPSVLAPPSDEVLQAFLRQNISQRASLPRPLKAGRWSSAYDFSVGGDAFILRLSTLGEDFGRDRRAANLDQPGLPVPEFISVGNALGSYFAITRRAYGTFLNRLNGAQASRALPSLMATLDAMRLVDTSDTSGFGCWDWRGNGPYPSWRQALLSVTDHNPRINGWQDFLRTMPECQKAFDLALPLFQQRVERVPELRHVIHTDMMNQNVLVGEQAGNVTAVYDWGCANYGDFLYDVAHIAFRAPLSDGIQTQRFLKTARSYFEERQAFVQDFDLRIETYLLHMGLESLAHHAYHAKQEQVTGAVPTPLPASERAGQLAKILVGIVDGLSTSPDITR